MHLSYSAVATLQVQGRLLSTLVDQQAKKVINPCPFQNPFQKQAKCCFYGHNWWEKSDTCFHWINLNCCSSGISTSKLRHTYENTSQAITKCSNCMTEGESCNRDVSVSRNCVWNLWLKLVETLHLWRVQLEVQCAFWQACSTLGEIGHEGKSKKKLLLNSWSLPGKVNTIEAWQNVWRRILV